jgi:hypothetical protein
MEKSFDFCLKRQINIRSGDDVIQGCISVGGIYKIPSHDHWGCNWTLSGARITRDPDQGVIYGEDALQALALCIQFLNKLIRDAAADGLQIWWLEEGDHCALLKFE